MGNSMAKFVGRALCNSIVFAPMFAIYGSWLGSAVCFGPGTIAGAVTGGVFGIGTAMFTAYYCNDDDNERNSSASYFIHPTTKGVLASSSSEPSFFESCSTSSHGPYSANCQFCSEVGKGCECCDYSGTYLHT
jgi:hypothetical protein